MTGGAAIREAFQAAARAHAERPAVRAGPAVWTYGELLERAEACRSAIASRLDAGPVLFAPRNTRESVAAMLGAIGSGRVPLFADPTWTSAELESVVRRCGVAGYLSQGNLPLAGAWEPAAPVLEGLGLARRVPAPGEDAPRVPRPDTAFGRFTSGTTAFSRCLEFTDAAALAAAAGWRKAAGIGPADRVLCLATLNNGLAFNTSLLTVLLAGGLLAFHSGPLVRSAMARTLAAVEPTVLVAFPFVYEQFARSARAWEVPRALRLAVSSAAPLPADVREAWGREAGLRLCDYYGLVEVGPCTFNDGTVPGSLGAPLEGTSLIVTGDAGEPLSAGEAGQVRVKTPSMASGYLDGGGPPFSENLDADGYYRTKDRAAVTPEGVLRLMGRMDELVNVAGRKISPAEVERVLRTLPGVQDALVRGEVADGRAILAAYVESQSVQRQEVVDFCVARLAPYKIPQRIAVLAALPRSATGKPSLGSIDARAGGAAPGMEETR